MRRPGHFRGAARALALSRGGDGTVAWQRGWTDLPAGRTVAELWDGQVREQLDRLVL